MKTKIDIDSKFEYRDNENFTRRLLIDAAIILVVSILIGLSIVLCIGKIFDVTTIPCWV